MSPSATPVRAADVESATARPAAAGMTRAIAALVLGALLIGFAPIAVRLSEVGPQATAFWRFAFSLPVIAFLALRFDHGLTPPAAARGFILAAGLCFGIDIAFWHAAITSTSVANATLLSNLTPLVVGLFSLLLFKEKIPLNVVMGGAIGMIGAACLAGASFSTAPTRLLGDGLAAVTALWYGSYLVFVRQARKSSPPFITAFWVTLAALCVCLATALALEPRFAPASLRGWAVLIGLGAIVHAIGQGAIVFALGRAPAALASVVVLVQPVMASALGYLLFGETFGALDFLGAGLVLVSVWLAQNRPRTPVTGEARS